MNFPIFLVDVIFEEEVTMMEKLMPNSIITPRSNNSGRNRTAQPKKKTAQIKILRKNLLNIFLLFLSFLILLFMFGFPEFVALSAAIISLLIFVK